MLQFRFTGCKLLEHQEPAGPDMPAYCRHDQGEDSGRDPKDLQYKGRVHPGGGGGSSS